MAHDHAHAAHDEHVHAHWDTSIWPFVISFGILALAIAFSLNYVYHKPFAAVLSLGIGIPMIVAGIAGWTSEAMGKGEGLSFGAMGWFILAEAMIFLSLFVAYWYFRLNGFLQIENFIVGTNVQGTIFFCITGLHGSHVVVGLAIFIAGLFPAMRGNLDEGFSRTAGLYWHFVDIIWFFVVSQVYYW